MVQFTPLRGGKYRAEIGYIQLTVFANGYELIVFDQVTGGDCEYGGCAKGHKSEAACLDLHGGLGGLILRR